MLPFTDRSDNTDNILAEARRHFHVEGSRRNYLSIAGCTRRGAWLRRRFLLRLNTAGMSSQSAAEVAPLERAGWTLLEEI
jgi:hypothetical protein